MHFDISTFQTCDPYVDNGSVNYASTFEMWIELEHNAVKLREKRGGGVTEGVGVTVRDGCDCGEERG